MNTPARFSGFTRSGCGFAEAPRKDAVPAFWLARIDDAVGRRVPPLPWAVVGWRGGWVAMTTGNRCVVWGQGTDQIRSGGGRVSCFLLLLHLLSLIISFLLLLVIVVAGLAWRAVHMCESSGEGRYL